MSSVFAKAQAMVGLEYSSHDFDCADLCVLVQRELFQKQIHLPTHRRGRAGQAAQINVLKHELAMPVEQPFTGAAALYTSSSAGGWLWHIGTVFIEAFDIWILHNSKAIGHSVLTCHSEMKIKHLMNFQGFYAWK